MSQKPRIVVIDGTPFVEETTSTDVGIVTDLTPYVLIDQSAQINGGIPGKALILGNVPTTRQ